MNKKGMMLSMYLMPFMAGVVVGIIVGIVLLAFLVNNGYMDLSIIPI